MATKYQFITGVYESTINKVTDRASKISYNSCRNRHCPKCQTFTKEQWVEKQN